MNQPQSPRKEDRKGVLTLNLSAFASLVFHLGILLVLGGVVLVPAYVQKQTFKPANIQSELMVEDAPPPEMDEIVLEPEGGGGVGGPEPSYMEAAASTDTSSDSALDLIASDSTQSSFTIPTGGGVLAGTGISGVGSSGSGGGMGGGIGGGKGRGKGLFKGSIGGMNVEATHLSVVFDASGSMTGYLPNLLEQIANQFDEADVAVGLQASFNNFTAPPESPEWSQLWQQRVVKIKGKKVGNLLNEVMAKTMAIHQSSYKVTIGCGVLSVLAAQPETDALYIFSDFGEMNRGATPILDYLAATVVPRGVKLYLHICRKEEQTEMDFLSSVQPENKPRWEQALLLAKSSGGGVFIGPPKEPKAKDDPKSNKEKDDDKKKEDDRKKKK